MLTVSACWDEEADGQQEEKEEPGKTEKTCERGPTTQILDHLGTTERFVDLWLTGSLINYL